ncbi:unnamed protein product [Soboliphyme baturini]|uniref:Aa_trans domain-containing protein n=1 Tax=Soboliphyme baturini TaxID=241478 RepID=A0A183J5U9_9BILA|nr:unnamed protein product [Soboliphyme baturini]
MSDEFMSQKDLYSIVISVACVKFTLIKDRFPTIIVEGDNYPPPPIKAFLAQAVSAFKIVMLISIIFGINPFSYLGTGTPNIYSWAMDNKMSNVLKVISTEYWNNVDSRKVRNSFI